MKRIEQKVASSNEKIAEKYFRVKYLRRFKAIHQCLTGFWKRYPQLYENEKDWDRQVRKILRGIEADFYRDIGLLLNIRDGNGGYRSTPEPPSIAVSGNQDSENQDYWDERQQCLFTGLDILSGNKCNSGEGYGGY